MQLARDGKPVSAVVSLAAHNDNALFAHGRKMLGNILHHARGRVLHQNDARNTGLDGGAIHLAHLARGKHLSRFAVCYAKPHANPRAITTVISSGSSGAVLQWVTASMIFATISFGSLFRNRNAVSARRSTPNSSP